MNVELLTKVMNKLKRMRHPKHFDMASWATETECGTAACIAGHALLMEGYKVSFERFDYLPSSKFPVFRDPDGEEIDPQSEAAGLLGLTYKQASRLFFRSRWPDRFRKLGPGPREAAERIEHFIATKGRA